VNIRVHVHVTWVLMNYIFVNCDNTFSDSCLFENDASFDFQNFNSIILEIYVISDFDIINLDLKFVFATLVSISLQTIDLFTLITT
jgi:hypothetical protein